MIERDMADDKAERDAAEFLASQHVNQGAQGVGSDLKASNPKDAAATTRLDLSLFPTSAIAYGALAFVEGDLKYGGYNWRKAGVKASVYKAAQGRHGDKWWNGEDSDLKTMVPHLANQLACIAILIDAIESGELIDDRPPKQQVTLYDRFEKVVGHLQKLFPRRTPRYTEKPL
jgi:hypothetical protein